MAGSGKNYLPLLENEQVSVFCAFGEDFSVFKDKILDENLFSKHAVFIEKCVFMNQIHSNKVMFYPDINHANFTCDGLISSQKNTALCVLSADCLPLLLWHKSGIIAALHSGRQGSFDNILKVALQSIKKQNKDINSDDFILIIGPGICGKNYEINGEVLQYAKNHFKKFLQDKKLDLKSLVKKQAQNLGIKNIIDCNICTFSDERFFSYRKNQTPKRFVSVIALKG
ncbi:laccase domain-containing protein [Campylobacter sp. CCS1377]|uniref:Laccase domain-containing protein n=1 Tax=Campylobacter sp. CCS1377 TaxID=3158229 RepID=A0AAU7EA68_9BACT